MWELYIFGGGNKYSIGERRGLFAWGEESRRRTRPSVVHGKKDGGKFIAFVRDRETSEGAAHKLGEIGKRVEGKRIMLEAKFVILKFLEG
jgi:hypothetical protein